MNPKMEVKNQSQNRNQNQNQNKLKIRPNQRILKKVFKIISDKLLY